MKRLSLNLLSQGVSDGKFLGKTRLTFPQKPFSKEAFKVCICPQREYVNIPYTIFTLVNTGAVLFNIYNAYKISFNWKVKYASEFLSKEKYLPPGVSEPVLGLVDIPLLERNLPRIEELFQQDRLHFSFIHGDAKSGKSTYLLELIKNKRNCILMRCKSGDSAQKILSQALGMNEGVVSSLGSFGPDENVEELLEIMEGALERVKSKGHDENSLIVVEDLLSMGSPEDIHHMAKKFLSFYERRLCSVIFMSNNRFSYNYLTDNTRVGGFKERLRLYNMREIPQEQIQEELEKSETLSELLTKEEIVKLVSVTGSNFADILSIIEYCRNRGYGLERAIQQHLHSFVDQLRTFLLFDPETGKGRKDEELFVMFNIFDEFLTTKRVLRSYESCWNMKELYGVYDKVILEMNRGNYIKRYTKNFIYQVLTRRILMKVYTAILRDEQIQARRQVFEDWKKEKGLE